MLYFYSADCLFVLQSNQKPDLLHTLDASSIDPTFNAALVGNPPRVVIDLTEVDAVTTPAISMFLAASRKTEKAGGKVIFTGVRGLIADILHRCRLDAILTIATSMDAAIARARQ